jgi:hypothetical protein
VPLEVYRHVRQGPPRPYFGDATKPDPAWIDAFALRVAQLIRDDPGASRRLVDAATLASEFGVDRSWVYAHRERLGVVKLGTGVRPRLRFDVDVARAAMRSAPNEFARPAQADASANGARPRRTQRAPVAAATGDVLAIRPRRRR